MSDGADNPPGYFVGRPLSYEEKPAAAPPAQAVDEQVNAQVPGVPGYYAGRVNKGKTSAGDQSSAPAAQQNGEPSFLAKCLVCFSGGGNAR
ncbi:uncharacterized protein LOC133900826 isoform X2 [Phragmites australis]|uniref:uncharacterized protein LOC133900826 isoform X2 n=1 Tax=Phragmites australis TaxID=29695 RepID=UPI002D79936C|nr:uncharacterized protein LOC133900826 isoform X2 [Phragmites australis]